VKLTEGEPPPYQAAHAVGSKVLEDLVENILRKEKIVTSDKAPAVRLRFRNWT
jgi:hypothetical protein